MKMPLKQLREQAGLTQAELGKKLNIAPSTVGMWEKGYRSPDYEMLKRIADYFNVTTDYLLGHEAKKGQTLSEEQTTVLGIFDTLSTEGRHLFMGILSSLGITHTKGRQNVKVVQNNRGGNNYYGVVGGNFSSNVTIG